jgi:hypothetical protein
MYERCIDGLLQGNVRYRSGLVQSKHYNPSGKKLLDRINEDLNM